MIEVNDDGSIKLPALLLPSQMPVWLVFDAVGDFVGAGVTERAAQQVAEADQAQLFRPHRVIPLVWQELEQFKMYSIIEVLPQKEKS